MILIFYINNKSIIKCIDLKKYVLTILKGNGPCGCKYGNRCLNIIVLI